MWDFVNVRQPESETLLTSIKTQLAALQFNPLLDHTINKYLMIIPETEVGKSIQFKLDPVLSPFLCCREQCPGSKLKQEGFSCRPTARASG